LVSLDFDGADLVNLYIEIRSQIYHHFKITHLAASFLSLFNVSFLKKW